MLSLPTREQITYCLEVNCSFLTNNGACGFFAIKGVSINCKRFIGFTCTSKKNFKESEIVVMDRQEKLSELNAADNYLLLQYIISGYSVFFYNFCCLQGVSPIKSNIYREIVFY